jgi:hypothetical protein
MLDVCINVEKKCPPPRGNTGVLVSGKKKIEQASHQTHLYQRQGPFEEHHQGRRASQLTSVGDEAGGYDQQERSWDHNDDDGELDEARARAELAKNRWMRKQKIHQVSHSTACQLIDQIRLHHHPVTPHAAPPSF